MFAGRVVVFKGRDVVCKGREVVYAGRLLVFKGRKVVFEGRKVVFEGRKVVFEGRVVVCKGRVLVFGEGFVDFAGRRVEIVYPTNFSLSPDAYFETGDKLKFVVHSSGCCREDAYLLP